MANQTGIQARARWAPQVSYDPQFPPMAASQPAVYHSEVSGPMTDQPGDKAGANAALGFTPTNFGDCDLAFAEKPPENAGLFILLLAGQAKLTMSLLHGPGRKHRQNPMAFGFTSMASYGYEMVLACSIKIPLIF